MLELIHGHRLSWLFPAMPSTRTNHGGRPSRFSFTLGDRAALLVICVIAFFIALGTFWVLSQSIDLYFPADAGEYVADARALLGTGVREIRHAPLFPALVALLLGPFGPVSSTQLSMGIAIFLLPVSLFLMLRQWLPNLPSVVAASVSPLTPMTADLVGWGGGATLIGLDMMVLTIATMEAWLRENGKQGFVVGIFAGLTLMAHPFMGAGMILVLAVRYAVHLLSHRRFSADWSALGLRGILSFFAMVVPLFATTAGYYLSLRGTSPGVSLDFQRAADVLVWGTRGELAILFFLVLALALPIPVGRRALLFVALPVSVFVVLLPTFLQWDITYNLRVVYFLPVLMSVGVGMLAQLALETIADRGVPSALVSVCAVGLLVAAPIAATYGFGYADWTRIDSAYYQRIHAEDIPAFQYLSTGQGTVATSWSGGFYDEGKVNGWFVEGLSNRPAIGPGAPWTWTIANVGESELDLQRFFSGMAGIENGALQASASTTGHLADPAIQIGVGGFYYPLAYFNSLSNKYPVAVSPGTSPTVGTDTIEFMQPSTNSSSAVLERIQLNQSRVLVTYSLVGGSPSIGDWEIWIWPAYYVNWLITGSETTNLTATVSYRQGSITATYRAPDSGASLTYYESHPVWGIQTIAVRRSQASSVSVEIAIAGSDPTGILRQFDERDIAASFSITTVLVWTDTGWMFRFDNDTCYRRAFETTNLVVYDVAASCRG